MQFAMLFLLQNFPYTKIIPKRHGTQADFFDFFELFLTYFAAGLCIQCMFFNEMHKKFHAFCPKPLKEKNSISFFLHLHFPPDIPLSLPRQLFD